MTALAHVSGIPLEVDRERNDGPQTPPTANATAPTENETGSVATETNPRARESHCGGFLECCERRIKFINDHPMHSAQ